MPHPCQALVPLFERVDAVDALLAALEKFPSQATAFQCLEVIAFRFYSLKNENRLQELAVKVPAGSWGRYVPLYLLGCMAADRNDLETMDEYFQAAMKLAAETLPRLREAGLSNSPRALFQQGTYIDTQWNPTGDTLLAPRVRPQNEPASGYRILASCNGIYFDAFVERFLEPLSLLNHLKGVHLWVCQPTARTRELSQRLESSQVHIEFVEINSTHPVHFACLRLQRAAQIMRNFSEDIIISDLDAQMVGTRLDLEWERLPRQWDAAWFEYPGEGPMLTTHLSLAWFRNSAASEVFLQALGQYITQKLAVMDEFWTLDQCALYLLSRKQNFKWPTLEAEMAFRTFRFKDWHLQNLELKDLQTNIEISESAKFELRRSSEKTYSAFIQAPLFDERGRLSGFRSI